MQTKWEEFCQKQIEDLKSYNNREFIKLLEEKSMKIANELLEVFSYYIIEMRKCIIITFEDTEDYIYKMKYKNNKYEITIFDSPEICGYNSVLSNYDETTYLFVQIIQIKEEKKHYEMFFGFDILNITFLELFDIQHYTKKGYIKECRNIEKLQEKLIKK